MQPVAFVTECAKGRARHTPLKRYFIMFVRGTPCSSWVLCGLGKKERHKAATCNCAPQGIVCVFVWDTPCSSSVYVI